MSNLVGKKFVYAGWMLEVLTPLGNNEYVCKWVKKPFASNPDHIVITEASLNDWREVREPRVIYVNDWSSTDVYRSISFKDRRQAESFARRGGYKKTCKFIEVLD